MASKKTPTDDNGASVSYLPLIDLRHSPTNPRKTYHETELKELGESIRANGIINPITVRPVFESESSSRSLPPGILHYEVVAGNRRFRAAQLIGAQSIACIIRDLTDEQVMDLQIAENLHRQDVPPLEEAAAFQAMLDTRKIDIEMLAGKVGKSTRYIYRRLKLNNLGEDYRPYLENGSLSATTAEVLSAYPKDAQKAIFKTTFYVTGDGTKIFDTGIRIKNALERETCNKLKKAIFPIDEADLQPGLVACTACEKNTAVATLLFPDGSDNPTCTDKACWKLKEQVFAGLRVNEYEAYCKQEGIEPVYCDLYYYSSDDKKMLTKLLGSEPKIISPSDYERCDPDTPGARKTLFVGTNYWSSDPVPSYQFGYVLLEKPNRDYVDYQTREILQDDTLSDDEKQERIDALRLERQARAQAEAERLHAKKWKQQMAQYVLQETPLVRPVEPLLRLWVKQLAEDDMTSWWKYLFGERLLDWRPESFPGCAAYKELVESAEDEWDKTAVSTWRNIILTFEPDRDKSVWRSLSKSDKQQFIAKTADDCDLEALMGIQARVMMVELFQAEYSWSGTMIDVWDYAPLLALTGAVAAQFEPDKEVPAEEEDEDEYGCDEEEDDE